ncbi:MAG: hypothetical protein RMJ35_13960, partial [Phycisphaerales bacterium]|nr:hypothetical protein [Phycisphaerales bacterium]
VREKCTIDQAGYRLFPNGERYLKSPAQMQRLFAACPEALRAGVQIAERCLFSLSELRYEYPDELAPAGKTVTEYLRELTWRGAMERLAHPLQRQQGLENTALAPGEQADVSRCDDGPVHSCMGNCPSEPVGFSPCPGSVPIGEKEKQLIQYELNLIEQLKFEPYFLTVYDLVRFARSRGILCQGRGSAANSAVCYCLGITSVDPSKIDLLFERFISAERNEYPDIDVDFEHERREEVIQYLYDKYGRDRAGMAAEVITYRGRSAIRDVGKALGLSLDMVDSMARKLDWWHRGVLSDPMLRETGLDPNDPNVRRVIALASELLGFPRHLGQHVGGMVITRGPLCEVVPIENAAMENRTVIEWDKDDIEELGILKVDCLGLGMLTCISKAFDILHKETEKRRDRETKGVVQAGDGNGKRAHIPAVDCVAERHGAGEGGLSAHSCNAPGGEIRTDAPDAPKCGFSALEHCRGIQQAKPARFDQVPSNCQRIPQRTANAVRACNRTEDDVIQPGNHGADCRNGPPSSVALPKSGGQDPAPSHSVSSSPARFVSPSRRSIAP